MDWADGVSMEEDILRFVYEYHEEHHWAPSYREIMAAVGLRAVSTIMYYVHKLSYEGLIRLGGGSRTIAVTDKGLERIGVV